MALLVFTIYAISHQEIFMENTWMVKSVDFLAGVKKITTYKHFDTPPTGALSGEHQAFPQEWGLLFYYFIFTIVAREYET